jgi:hypothetical protein
VSGTGLRLPDARSPYSRLAWTLGMLGVALLIFGGAPCRPGSGWR